MPSATGDEIPERVVERVRSLVPHPHGVECIIWPLSTGSHGYGQIGWGAKNEKASGTTAHRAVWLSYVGPIGDLTVDHLCRNRRCVNLDHLRLLSNVDNASDNGLATRSSCPAGHEYAGDNLHLTPAGHRRCKKCARESQRIQYQKDPKKFIERSRVNQLRARLAKSNPTQKDF